MQHDTETLLAHGYTHDPVGNLETWQRDEGTWDVAYDPLYRMEQAGAETYGYDPTGNLTRKHTTGYEYDSSAHAHAVTQAGDDHFEYDLDGNMTLREEGDTAYVQQFDVENRLVAVTVTRGITSTVQRYGYDGDGNLAWREAGGEVELYIGEAVVIRGLSELPLPPPPTSHTIHLPLVARNAGAELPPVPSFQAVPFEGERYYRLGGAVVGWRVGSSAESVVYWLHGDHLGSIVRVTDETGEQVLARGYDAWGEIAWATGTLTLTLPLGYTGQMYDENIGLLYLHARWYYPGLARFVSTDTIVPQPGNPQDFNRYSYAVNSPLKYTDPSGHAVDPGGAWGAPWPPLPLLMLPLTLADYPATPNTAPVEVGVSALPDLYDLAEGTRGTASGITMLRGGFRLVQGSTYAGQTIVHGTAEAKAAAGLVPQFTHAAASHPALASHAGPLGAAERAAGSYATAAALGINYGVDIYQYGWGSKRDVGLNSSEFAAAMTADTVIQLGPPALGAGVGFALAGPPGAVIGGGIGSIFSAGWSFLGRDATVSFTDEHMWGPIWAWESQHSAVYPEFHYYYPYHGPTIP